MIILFYLRPRNELLNNGRVKSTAQAFNEVSTVFNAAKVESVTIPISYIIRVHDS